ncbi:hypothetical protein [Emticicia sp. SJ17W-69]|uniref:hypothetical protein n=1 Tax=Emticicia sp. SJ17W-69 TaxID=3421657 RepID=UPI003EBE116B
MRKLFFISLLLFGCNESSSNENTPKYYYDLAGFINQQISQLSKNQPITWKNLLIGEKTESIQTKDIDWKKELELFLQADLNKQSYQLSYTKDSTQNKVVYQLKKGENLPVKVLKIEFDQENSPKHIDALIQVANYLYKSEKNLSMDLDKKQLKNYQIKGWQELFIGQKKNFKMIGVVGK